MDPVTISLIVGLLGKAVEEAPALVSDFQSLFASGAPTPADFAALQASIQAETYGQFVPASQLPPSETSQ